MAKAKKTAFFCQNCGYESAKWMGQCPACREWNTFVEEPTAAKTPAGNQGLGSHSAAGRKPVHLTEISTGKEERIPTGIGELDRVLGGGIVPGSLTLVGGDPGIGKSTLLLQVCRMLSTAGHQVLYISGEESLRQIKLRAVRIGEFNENLSLLCETNLDIIRAVMEYVQIGNCGSWNGFVYEQSVSLQLCDFLKGFYFIQISSVLKIRFFCLCRKLIISEADASVCLCAD